MKKAFLTLAAAASLSMGAQTPELEFVMDLNVEIAGQGVTVGAVPGGYRNIVPITGGTFEGPQLSGEVLSGGADYQLYRQGGSQVDAIYSIRTADSVNIFVHNMGVADQSYFFTSPRFEAPLDSKYAWLNQRIFVCRPVGFGQGMIKLRVWGVAEQGKTALDVPEFGSVPEALYQPAAKRGRVEEMRYTATVDGQQFDKRAQVYLPNGYDKKKQYNVVYLMHGGGDNTTSFFADPRSPLPLVNVLDHLIADGKMEPVIVVAPTYYYDDQNIGDNSFDQAVHLVKVFHDEFANYVIPAVEAKYSVAPGRDHRAFGGFSMGALCAWYQMAYGLDQAKYYLPLSGDLWIYDNENQKQPASVAAAWLSERIAAAPQDFMVYGYTGTEDIAGTPEHNLFEALRVHAPQFVINQPGGNAVFKMKPGGQHYYGDINQYLYEILPLLFK